MEIGTIVWCMLVGAAPLLVRAVWHLNDEFFRLTFRVKNRTKGKLPPGHMGLPFIGEMITFLWYFKFLRRPDDYINSKKIKYGEELGIYRSHLLGSPTIITCSAETNKFALQSTDLIIRWPSVELVGRNSILNSEGKNHAKMKNFVVNAINHPEALKRIAQEVQPHVVSTLKAWADKGTINANCETKKVIYENICQIFVSKGPGPLLDEMNKWFEGLIAGFKAYPLNFPGTAFHHALKCRKRLNATFREELEKRKKGETKADKGGDLMDGLMSIKNENGEQLSDDEVVENIVILVNGGFESTAAALMWALYHLSKSPESLQKLREENARIKKAEKEDFITMDNISKLKYTAKVVEETIRIANIASLVPRVANKDVQYRGYTIPKGWQVLIWLRSVHIDASNFHDPFSFKPERWDNPPKPGTFVVFGGGRRICAGNMLARIQLTVMLHHLSLGYKWELLNPDAKINYLPLPRPADGAIMKFSKLDEAPAI